MCKMSIKCINMFINYSCINLCILICIIRISMYPLFTWNFSLFSTSKYLQYWIWISIKCMYCMCKQYCSMCIYMYQWICNCQYYLCCMSNWSNCMFIRNCSNYLWKWILYYIRIMYRMYNRSCYLYISNSYYHLQRRLL